METHRSHFWLKFFESLLLIVAFSMALFLVASGTEQYWRKPDLEVNMTQPSTLNPNDSVVLKFNQSVDPVKMEKNIALNPKAEISLKWKSENKELTIEPVSYFKPGEEFILTISLPRGIFKNKTEERKFRFSIHDFPKVESVVPDKDASSIKIDSDIKVSFDAPVNKYNINFEINPHQQFTWEADEEKKEFRIFSKDKLPYDTAYWMKITAQPVSRSGEAEKREIFYGKFETEKRPVPIAVKSNSAVIPENEVVDLYARVEEGKYIDINLAKQHLSIFDSKERLGTYRISSGKRGMATPTGNFKIMGKRGRAWSNKYKLFMPYFMQFTGVGHGIHELPEWPGGYKEGAAHLGIPVSHGCVRLGVGPAQTVYEFASVGTPVVIHY